jgi:AmiR/NasT family two-component response regulator
MRALRALVVEDEALDRLAAGRDARGDGHEICGIAASEADAVATAVRCRPDLMIVDARLGRGSGVSAVEKLRYNGLVPHLFVSGDSLGFRRSGQMRS